MKGIIAKFGAVLAVCSATGLASPLQERQNSPSWSGANLYYLQGISDADQDAYIQKLSDYNAKVIRLWVNSQGQGCQKDSKIFEISRRWRRQLANTTRSPPTSWTKS